MVGGIAGYYGGAVDNVLMRVCEVIMSIPTFYLLIALAGLLPPELDPRLHPAAARATRAMLAATTAVLCLSMLPR